MKTSNTAFSSTRSRHCSKNCFLAADDSRSQKPAAETKERRGPWGRFDLQDLDSNGLLEEMLLDLRVRCRAA